VVVQVTMRREGEKQLDVIFVTGNRKLERQTYNLEGIIRCPSSVVLPSLLRVHGVGGVTNGSFERFRFPRGASLELGTEDFDMFAGMNRE